MKQRGKFMQAMLSVLALFDKNKDAINFIPEVSGTRSVKMGPKPNYFSRKQWKRRKIRLRLTKQSRKANRP
jgi:hypothetical protein